MSAPQSLGAYLRAIRERRGLSLEDVAHVSRVPVRHLAALEREDLATLPAPVFVRGFLRAFCEALGEPPDAALRHYQQLAGPPAAPPAPARPVAPPPEPRRSRSSVLVSLGLLVVLGLALFGVTVALQPGRLGEPPREESSIPETMAGDAGMPAAALYTEGELPADPPTPASAGPGVTEAPPARPTVAATRPSPTAPANGASAAPPSAPAADLAAASPPGLPDLAAVLGPVRSPYRLVAYVSEPTWIRVRMADGRVSEETVPAGQTREWVSNAPFVVTLGNAGGVSLELNGQSLPTLGRRGAVIPRLVLPPVSPQ